MPNKVSGEPLLLKPLHGVRQAHEFLCQVAGAPGTSFQFRAIHDRNKSRPSVNLCGTFEGLEPRLTRLNELGYGIFVIVNEATGTTDATVINVRCVFVDLDRDELPDREARLLYFAGSPIGISIKSTTGFAPMSMVVESSPEKYHVYWRCHAMPLDRFKPFQRELAHLFGGDPAVCNLSRVMRVPGLLHQKGEPFLSRVVSVRSGYPNIVTADNLERALARAKKKFKVGAPPEPQQVHAAATPFDLAAIDGLLGCVGNAEVGERNNVLFWAACRLVEQTACEDAFVLLEEAGEQAGLPYPEILSTIASARRRAA